ncbi:MAG: DUF4062 domain-containing protein [Proteobacteria bacterium]|nr:DUF4062 domain-containing protein [Pseudomonadota bacterium]
MDTGNPILEAVRVLEKRFQVFVSSTYIDLQEERRQVMQALLELDCIPSGMELFPASDEEKWELIRRVIDDCDYYILIIGGRYGSVDEHGVSYTEREYDYAAEAKKPCLCFVHASPGDIPLNKSEINPVLIPRLDAFIHKVESKMCQRYTNPDELGGKVSRSLIQLMKRKPAEGWVRSRYATDPILLSSLRERIAQLENSREMSSSKTKAATEHLQQGEDEYEITVNCSEYRGGEICSWSLVIKMTWDNVYWELGPVMIGECSEHDLKRKLAEVIVYYQPDSPEKQVDISSAHREIYDDCFHTIMIQLAALKLIEKSIKKHSVDDKSTYWTLTQYGEDYLVNMRALKKKH